MRDFRRFSLDHEKDEMCFLFVCISESHGTGDVDGEHEIRLGIRHHGRVATHGDFQKNHIRKDFPAILRRKWTKCEF